MSVVESESYFSILSPHRFFLLLSLLQDPSNFYDLLNSLLNDSSPNAQ
jgi:hypothetical protein